MLNKVLLLGRLAKDPTIRLLPSGMGIAEFTIAWSRRYKVKDDWKEEVGFFDCKAVGALAKRIVDMLNKGDLVVVEGRLVQERWEKDGKLQSRVRVLVQNIKRVQAPKKEEEPPVEEPLGEEPQMEEHSDEEPLIEL